MGARASTGGSPCGAGSRWSPANPSPSMVARRFGIGPVRAGPTSPRNEVAFGARFG
jgi:hypothetical protein